jgi:hypothetical protein
MPLLLVNLSEKEKQLTKGSIMADYEQVGTRNPDGMKFGAAATDKIGLFGSTPVVQQTAPSTLTGASDTTAVATAVNLLTTALTNLGLIA